MGDKKYSFESVIFDLDGVITKTALVHAAAWKATFDEYLRLREKRDSEPFREFTHEKDYLPYVDGKPRYKGVKSFLESRGINIEYGDSLDSPDKETICGIGNKKNKMFREILEKQGVEVYPGSIHLIHALKKAGIRIGVASSSKNCKQILENADIEELFETRVDGVVSAELGLTGKPEGDIFVTAARNLGTDPAKSVVVEDATSGVAAGRNGGFGFVLGVARENNESKLKENGADVVVRDLSEINIEYVEKWFHRKPKSLLKSWKDVKPVFLSGKKLVFFLDYDGTLTPIVERPELAVMSQDMRGILKKLSQRHTLAIVSGRMREDVEKLVGIDGLIYAGSHGFDIEGGGYSMIHPQVKNVVPIISEVIEKLLKEVGSIPGVIIEKKKFSVAVHYRLVDEKKFLPKIKSAVDKVNRNYDKLRLMCGKKVFEILPDIVWDKGKAVRWILGALKIAWKDASVMYIGDDVTDEDAFRIVRTRGIAILVADKIKESTADFWVSSPDELKKLFEKIIESS